MSSTLKDNNSIDVSALAHSPIRAEQDESSAVSNSTITEVREQLSSLPLDDENLHQAMRDAGDDPAALSADKSQVTLAFHPNVIAAYSKLQSLQGDLRQVATSAADGAESRKCLPGQVVEFDVKNRESRLTSMLCDHTHKATLRAIGISAGTCSGSCRGR